NIISEYDFGNNLVRQTKKTFWSNSIHVTGVPTDIQVLDGGNNLVSETSYTYDEYSTYPLQSRTGATQHDDQNYGTGNVVRANPTTVTRWLLPPAVQTKTGLSSQNKYDTLGNVIWTQDPKGYQTTLDYTDSFSGSTCAPSASTYAYLTKTSLPQT